ncbi:hypothetical protein KA525_03825 [Candidatus Woesebacteria bacterium]|nr:hypothetical protein [Candidatus Woesebacteria bacterium]
MTVNEVRELLPDKTNDLIDAQVQFIISRIGDVEPEKFRQAWEREHDLHVKEMAFFLYDMYQKKKHTEATLSNQHENSQEVL